MILKICVSKVIVEKGKTMNCQTVQKLYLSYIDKDLPDVDLVQVQEHLCSCPECAKKVDLLREIYQPKGKLQKIEPPPFLWQNLYLKISKQEEKKAMFSYSEKLLQFATNLGIAIVFIISITLGIYLGNSPNLNTMERITEPQDVIVSDEFENDSFINTLDDLPRESLGNVYLTMEME